MPLNVKDSVVLWVIEDESDLPWFVFIGFFDICQYLSENVCRKRVKTIDGGSHESGFKTALTRVFNDYAKTNGFVKGKDKSW